MEAELIQKMIEGFKYDNNFESFYTDLKTVQINYKEDDNGSFTFPYYLQSYSGKISILKFGEDKYEVTIEL